MTKILVIAPYQGLKDLIMEVNQELNRDIHVEVGDLYKGVAIAKSMELDGFDIIISRGATARLLQDFCKIPIVELKISGYDILRMLTLVKGYPGKIGLMSYSTTIQGADVIGTLLEMNISFFPIKDEEEVTIGIKIALEQGIQVIIGDVISTSVATQYGLKSILITSGKEAVIEAIHEAERMAYYIKSERQQKQLFESILQNCPEGIVVVDESGDVCLFNHKAEEMLNLKFERVMGLAAKDTHSLLDFDDSGAKDHASQEFVMVNQQDLMIKKCAINDAGKIIGRYAILKRPTQHQITLEKELQAQLKNRGIAKTHYNQLIATTKAMKEVIEVAKHFAQTTEPILLLGERGTGKRGIAEAIHNGSERCNNAFIYVDCRNFNEQELELQFFGLVQNNDSNRGILELANAGTVYIAAIDHAPPSILNKLYQVVLNKSMKPVGGKEEILIDVRFIASCSQRLENNMRLGECSNTLLKMFHNRQLIIPPLREHKKDIDELVRWFIASFNPKLGKQIVGCRGEVLSILKSEEWPGNIEQLKQAIEQMCLITTGPFIDIKEVHGILDSLKTKEYQRENNEVDIMGKTLEQIENEVILRVLEQEGFNQSQAASRLGVNRATLWRKLKSFQKLT